MNLSLSFFVPGPCVALARPRVVHKGSRVVAFTPEKSQAYKRHVALHALNARNRLPGWRTDWAAYFVSATIYRRERGFDLDNGIKSFLDAMIGIIFQDDRAVVSIEAEFVDCCEGVEVNEDGKQWPEGVQLEVMMLGEHSAEQDKRARARMLAKARRAGG